MDVVSKDVATGCNFALVSLGSWGYVHLFCASS